MAFEKAQKKWESLSSALKPFAEKALNLCSQYPIAATGIAGGAVAASYVASFAYNRIRSPSPNVRMISISNKDTQGSQSQRPLLVLIHGWPDVPDMWGNVINALYKNYDLLLIELPNFNFHTNEMTFLFGDDPESSTSSVRKARAYPTDCVITYHIFNQKDGTIGSSMDSSKMPCRCNKGNNWGWPIAVMVDSVLRAVGNYVNKFRGDNKDVTFVLHDWGATMGLSAYYVLPQLPPNLQFNIARIATLDIGDTFEPVKKTDMLTLLSYQWYNAGWFLSPVPFVRDVMSYLMCVRVFSPPLYRQNRLWKHWDRRINHSYFWIWLEILYPSFFNMFGIQKWTRSRDKFPTVPVYFACPSAEKRFLKFHSTNWKKEIERRNAIKGYEGCYIYQVVENSLHWVQYEDENDYDQVIDSMQQWLRTTDGKDLQFVEP